MGAIGFGKTFGYYSPSELRNNGVTVGRGSKIACSVELVGVEHIEIGENVRIDGDVFISAGPKKVVIDDHVHIARGVYIFGSSDQVYVGKLAGISPRSTLMTATDSFDQPVVCVPNVPEKYRDVVTGPVILEEMAMVGAHSLVLPNVNMQYGAALGANGLLLPDTVVEPGDVLVGCPAKRCVGHRDIVELMRKSKEFCSTWTRS